MSITEVIRRVVDGASLDEHAMAGVVESIMAGEATSAQAAALLIALRMRGETVSEVVGAVRALRRRMVPVKWAGTLVDTCGTGGDGASTFNISTTAALVAAAAGTVVAKHGNRAMSSQVGGADVLQELGISIELGPDGVRRCLKEVGMAFFFAPIYHPAFKALAAVRREIGVRTIANLLGPLLNPAGAKVQLLGVFSERWTAPLAEALARLGATRALVVHGLDGLDEISLGAETVVSELDDGRVNSYRISPDQLGMKRCPRELLRVGSAKESAAVTRSVLGGEKGPRRDVVLLNAGATIWLGGGAAGLAEGIARAQKAIDSGAASAKLKEFIRVSTEAASR